MYRYIGEHKPYLRTRSNLLSGHSHVLYTVIGVTLAELSKLLAGALRTMEMYWKRRSGTTLMVIRYLSFHQIFLCYTLRR